MNRNGLKRISVNAPVIIAFVACCLVAYILNLITGGRSNQAIFSVYPTSFLDPLQYVRCICHIFGHASWEHLLSNMMYILILGPMIEEKYGGKFVLVTFAAVAVGTAIINMLLFPHTGLLGTSGVVFAFIIVASITGNHEGKIPLTLILVAVLFIGQQIIEGITVQDNISQLTHIVGGVIGGILAMQANRFRS